MTALVAAIRQGDLPAARALIEATPELVTATASAPPRKDDGQSALQIALKSGQSAIADYLIERGADVDFIEVSAINAWRAPVLHDAIRNALITLCYEGDFAARSDAGLAVLEKLLARGADPNGRDSLGNTPLVRAILDGKQALDPIRDKATESVRAEKVGNVFTTLRRAGAKVDALDETTRTIARSAKLEQFLR